MQERGAFERPVFLWQSKKNPRDNKKTVGDLSPTVL